MGVESKAMPTPGQADNRQPPAAVRVLAGAPDKHLVKMGAEKVITASVPAPWGSKRSSLR